MVRRIVYYSGRVQGVGFRATVSWLARDYRVAGYVRNLADGRVEMAAEGETAELDRFELRIREEFRGNVTHVERSDGAARGDFSGFEIRH